MSDTLVAVGAEARLGTTLLAKNSDRSPDECQRWLQFPAAFHAPGSAVRCTHIEVPQVAETYAAMGHSPWWVWGFEHGVNEHGVAIGYQALSLREPVEAKLGLIGADLVRLGLERGRNAREALEIIATLLESHGQGGPARSRGGSGCHNSFVIGDPSEAWIMETSNRRWAARRAARDALSNSLTLGCDWEIGSRDLESFAHEREWWGGTGRIDVSEAYRNRDVTGGAAGARLRRARELLEAEGRVDLQRMQAALRDHWNADRGDLRGDPGVGSGDADSLCVHSDDWATTASMVAPLPRDRTRPWPVWVSFASPCTGVFLPVYLDAPLPAAAAAGGEEPDARAAWWCFKALQDAATGDLVGHAPRLREVWKSFEAELEGMREAAEREASQLRSWGQGDAARDRLLTFTEWAWDTALERARDLVTTLES